MMEYLSPGVYAESINKANAPIGAVSASVGGFVGITVRGAVNVPTLVNSWQDFLNKFAYGMETPFMEDSDLAYAVYGFFQNGGTKCYVIRTASGGTKKATCKVGDTLTLSAKDEGSWANKMSVQVTSAGTDKVNILVKLNGEVVEQINDVETKPASGLAYYLKDVLDNSKYIAFSNVTGSFSATTADVAFTGGDDGFDAVFSDEDYEKSLNLFDSVDDVNLICVPGETSEAMTKIILAYAEKRGNVFAIVDGAQSADVTAIKTFRESLSCKNGALYYPWIKVSDPLSKTGKLRDCPACGHIMGVYARTIQERGVWKAPAGVEAVIRGAVDVVSLLVKADCDTLNPVGVNAVMPRANYGIVVWGARGLNPDSSMKYVSDVLLNTNIKESIKNGTQWAVFEPNNKLLWNRVKTSVTSYLDGLWRAGGLVGDSAEQAYFVKCDEDLNTEDAVNAGQLICEVGYAPTKPAEFVVFRISHSISND